VVVELECGITVYPARGEGDRWRAVWYESGQRRQCEAMAEDKLAAKLAKVAERLAAEAPNMERPGVDLIAWYLCLDRHWASRPWSRRHADTQRRLCVRFVAPVIGAVPCQRGFGRCRGCRLAWVATCRCLFRRTVAASPT